jgi:lysophospholipase L1-like esterase
MPTSIEISSQGLRDREYTLTKPENTKRIAVLGDSIAFGWGVENNQCFPKLLEKMLNTCSKKYKYEVLNFAVPGYNLEQELIALREKVIKFNVDYALLYSNNNDFEDPIMNKDIFWGLFERSYITRMIYFSHRKILGKFKISLRSHLYYSKGVNKVIPVFESLAPILRNNSIKLCIVFHNMSHDNISDLKKLNNYLEINNIVFLMIDNYPNWSSNDEIPKDYHPNIEGHKIISETIFPFLRKIVIDSDKEDVKSRLYN